MFFGFVSCGSWDFSSFIYGGVWFWYLYYLWGLVGLFICCTVFKLYTLNTSQIETVSSFIPSVLTKMLFVYDQFNNHNFVNKYKKYIF